MLQIDKNELKKVILSALETGNIMGYYLFGKAKENWKDLTCSQFYKMFDDLLKYDEEVKSCFNQVIDRILEDAKVLDDIKKKMRSDIAAARLAELEAKGSDIPGKMTPNVRKGLENIRKLQMLGDRR